jgi:general secretion pathway protein A
MPSYSRSRNTTYIMYDEFFGLKETPFSIAPDPRFLYMSERHREALAHLLFGIGTDGGFVLLSGEVGTGKTTISRCLLEQIPGNANVAMVLNPKVIAGELLATICDELNIEYPEGNTSIKVFVDRINKYLLDTHAKGRKTVVLIEESQNLTPDVLEQLRLLTNLETRQRKLLQVIMIGQPELLDLLARPELRQLEQRVTARYHLMPLSAKDTADYVRHRLSVAGVKEPVFSAAILKKVHRLTGGIPRKINLLCDRAMLGAYTRNQHTVDNKILQQAALEVFGKDENAQRQHTRDRRLVIAGITAMLVAAVGAVLYVDRESFLSRYLAGQTHQSLQEQSQQSLQWLDSQLASDDPVAGYASLFNEWHMTYSGGDVDPCDFAQNYGLACLAKKGDLQELVGLNRPAVVALQNSEGKKVYVALSELNTDSALLKSASEQHRIALGDLVKRWKGEYTLLWRMPPHFTGAIKPGSEGPDVNWLANQLATILGTPMAGGESISYDAELMEKVRTFQTRAGLVSDGVAGTHTLIYINTAIDRTVPQLVKKHDKTSATKFSRFDISAIFNTHRQKADS